MQVQSTHEAVTREEERRGGEHSNEAAKTYFRYARTRIPSNLSYKR